MYVGLTDVYLEVLFGTTSSLQVGHPIETSWIRTLNACNISPYIYTYIIYIPTGAVVLRSKYVGSPPTTHEADLQKLPSCVTVCS